MLIDFARNQSTVSGAIPSQVVMGCIRKQTEGALGQKGFTVRVISWDRSSRSPVSFFVGTLSMQYDSYLSASFLCLLHRCSRQTTSLVLFHCFHSNSLLSLATHQELASLVTAELGWESTLVQFGQRIWLCRTWTHIHNVSLGTAICTVPRVGVGNHKSFCAWSSECCRV